MARAQQKRTLETRSRLIAATEKIIEMRGFEKLRVEEVVLLAGTAKGTFFAHFKDKDALMDQIIGGRIDQHLDRLAVLAAPDTVEDLVEALIPLSDFITSERYVFDLILRYSGAAAVEEIGHIAMTFGRQIEIFESWLAKTQFRQDITPGLQAEGVQAFMVQAMATKFCALHNTQSVKTRLKAYLVAWLRP